MRKSDYTLVPFEQLGRGLWADIRPAEPDQQQIERLAAEERARRRLEQWERSCAKAKPKPGASSCSLGGAEPPWMWSWIESAPPSEWKLTPLGAPAGFHLRGYEVEQ